MVIIENGIKQHTDRIEIHKIHQSKCIHGIVSNCTGSYIDYGCGDDKKQAKLCVSYRNDDN